MKIRGTAQQVQEKYLSLARDASSSGDWVSAEAYYQFAEHYHRIISANANNGAGKNQGQNQNRDQGDRTTQKQTSKNAAVQETSAPQADPKTDPQPSSESASKSKSAQEEAEVIDTSPAALAAAVAEREEAGVTKGSEPESDSVPEKAAS